MSIEKLFGELYREPSKEEGKTHTDDKRSEVVSRFFGQMRIPWKMLFIALFLFLFGSGIVKIHERLQSERRNAHFLTMVPRTQDNLASLPLNFSEKKTDFSIHLPVKKLFGISLSDTRPFDPKIDKISVILITPQGGQYPLLTGIKTARKQARSIFPKAYAQDTTSTFGLSPSLTPSAVNSAPASVAPEESESSQSPSNASGTIDPTTVVLTPGNDGGVVASVPSLDTLQQDIPGNYRLSINWTRDGVTYTSYQDLTWGVLTMNTEKDVYEKDQIVHTGIGLVDSRGETICNGVISVTIISPSGKKLDLRTYESGEKIGKLTVEQITAIEQLTGEPSQLIYRSKECGPQTVTNTPDYSFSFRGSEVGAYSLHAIAQTAQGEKYIDQTVRVVEGNPLVIKRTTASRIYPLASYTVSFALTAKDGYSGPVSETVPVGFTISCSSSCEERIDGQNKRLIWRVNLPAGKETTISYSYTPPPVSPALYLLGPLVTNIRTEERSWAIASDALAISTAGPRTATSSGDCTDDATVGTVAWTNPGNAAKFDGLFATASLNNSTSHYIKCVNFGFTTSMIPTGSSISGVLIAVNRKTGASTVRDSGVRLIVGGTIGTTDKAAVNMNYGTTLATGNHGGLGEMWGNSGLSVSNVTASNFGAAVSALKTAAPATTVSIEAVIITIYFMPPQVTLTQRHYLFEDDDGANVNSNTDNGTADTALTNVKKGERLNARFQIDNTGSSTFGPGQFELFYDRNDNIWSRVEASGSAAIISGTGNCTDTNWDCTIVDNSNSTRGNDASVAIDPSGNPWIAHGGYIDSSNFVGSGGNCPGSGGAWSCASLSQANANDASIAFTASGSAVIAYNNADKSSLAVTQFLGGNITSSCAGVTGAWGCTRIDAVGANAYTSVGVDPSDVIWISYKDSSSHLKVAKYVGSGGSGCGTNVTNWSCTVIDSSSANIGTGTSIDFDASGTPWISYVDTTNSDLKVAKFVGSGGNCSSSAWTCWTVDSSVTVSLYSDIAFDPSGNAWVAYKGANKVRYATYVASGGTCSDVAWSCNYVDQHTTISTPHIAFDAAGIAWISYNDDSQNLYVANYVGSGGSGCLSVTTWSCTVLDTQSAFTSYSSIAFSHTGKAFISYKDSSGYLKVASLKRGGEIIAGYGLSGSLQDTLTTNAAGSCTGGASFANGSWFGGVNVASSSALVSIPTNTCTEVAFMIDTSRAVVGSTYRLRLKNKTQDKGFDTYSNSPTFTVVSSNSDLYRASKESLASMSAACAIGNNWSCGVAYKGATAGGAWPGITVDANNNLYIAVYNTATQLTVAKFVGSGGNCPSATAWQCTTIDATSADVGSNASMATAPDGTMWVSYRSGTEGYLRMAANGPKAGLVPCTAPGWYCGPVDDIITDALGYESNIAFDKNGNPWIAYNDTTATALKVAQYVGVKGICTSDAWNCTIVDTLGSNSLDGDYPSLAFDQNGVAWVSYNDGTNTQLKLATNGGGFGSSCTDQTWTCGAVDNTGTATGQFTTILIDNNNKIWIGYSDQTNLTVRIAEFVGSGGNCTSAVFNCYALDSYTSGGADIGLILGADGYPRIGYRGTGGSALKYAKYVGSGGTGCTSTAWSCKLIDSSTLISNGVINRFITVDHSGLPVMIYYDGTGSQYKVAKMILPDFDQQLTYSLDNVGYSAVTSDDQTYDSVAATTNTPMYRFSKRFSSTAKRPAVEWIGKSTVAASTNNILLQVYRFGSTNDWETLSTNSSCAANAGCTIIATSAGTLSEYFDADPDGVNYWTHMRVYQLAGTSKTLSTNYMDAWTSANATKIVFTAGNPVVTSGVCSGASVPITFQLQDDSGTAQAPAGSTGVQVTSDSSSYTIYSDSSCSTQVSGGNFTVSTAETSKTFYLVDNVRGSHVLTATKTSGPDTLTAGTTYENTISANGDADSTTIQGGVNIQGGTTIR